MNFLKSKRIEPIYAEDSLPHSKIRKDYTIMCGLSLWRLLSSCRNSPARTVAQSYDSGTVLWPYQWFYRETHNRPPLGCRSTFSVFISISRCIRCFLLADCWQSSTVCVVSSSCILARRFSSGQSPDLQVTFKIVWHRIVMILLLKIAFAMQAMWLVSSGRQYWCASWLLLFFCWNHFNKFRRFPAILICQIATA